MSLFQCDSCGCVENTATSDGGYHIRYLLDKNTHFAVIESYKEVLGLKPEEEFGRYCCVCNPMWYIKECICNKVPHDPDCKRGSLGIGKAPFEKKWHNKFPRNFLEKGKWITNKVGNIEHIETHEEDFYKHVLYTDINSLAYEFLERFTEIFNHGLRKFKSNTNDQDIVGDVWEWVRKEIIKYQRGEWYKLAEFVEYHKDSSFVVMNSLIKDFTIKKIESLTNELQ